MITSKNARHIAKNKKHSLIFFILGSFGYLILERRVRIPVFKDGGDFLVRARVHFSGQLCFFRRLYLR